MPDGRPAFPNNLLKPVRRFADAVMQVWHDLYEPGSLLVADETMVEWTRVTNIHITMLPNKPTSKGVHLKTLCDVSTHVMINFEFVEGKVEQGVKHNAGGAGSQHRCSDTQFDSNVSFDVPECRHPNSQQQVQGLLQR
jgi:hypothetical protein